MDRRIIQIYILLFLAIPVLFGQDDPVWDDTSKSNWPTPFERIEIPSKKDGHMQRAIMYRSQSSTPKPLVISLHTWSGDYTQIDPLAQEILARDWNYIHPDFRGPNNSPEAMGSSLVISDIEDALNYALLHTHSDPKEVHIIGVSGGGYATLLAYMNLDYPIKSFSAWAPISDITSWYWESLGRKQKYAQDIFQATSSHGTFNKEEALKRSPLYQTYPIEKRKGAKLYIYEGVHDGYEGSVPITHAIHMYNRLVGELKYGRTDLSEILLKAASDPELVTEGEIIDLVTKRGNPKNDKEQALYGRAIHLFREFENIQLTIFEGGHEQLPQALSLIPYGKKSTISPKILTLGDSNGAHKQGWVAQLKSGLPDAKIVNISQSGRTIGFDNNGQKELNTLRNINTYLKQGRQQIKGEKFDYIILCLGTNDTKKVFADRQQEVAPHLERLLDHIVKSLENPGQTELIWVTPPPMATQGILEKYEGGNARLGKLAPQFEQIARNKAFKVLNMYHPLLNVLEHYAPDGIHMQAAGQKIIADRLIDLLEKSTQE